MSIGRIRRPVSDSSLNDLYMASLMTGWMTLIIAMSRNTTQAAAGAFVVVISIVCIRMQVGLTKISITWASSHHSMAVHLSRHAISNKKSPTESDVKSMRKVMDDRNGNRIHEV
jgi:hypothetical protein